MFHTRFWRGAIVATAFCGLFLSVASPGRAQTPSRIIAFGDSLSDNGNAFAISGGTVPGAPYFGGRLSNGPVWVERFAQAVGVPLNDFAVAGARTDTTNLSNTIPGVPAGTFPGMQTSVSGFLSASGNVADPNALYVLWGGANDYLNGGQVNPAVPVGNLVSQMTQLSAAGARRFLIPNLPDLGSIPGTSGGPFATALNQLTFFHNAGLSSALTSFSASVPTARVTLLDVNSLFRNAIANPSAFGFTNVTQNYVSSQGNLPGLTPLVVGTGNANQYLFWDEVHPTASAHQLIANTAVAATAVAPEPGSLALAGIGCWALGVRAGRRRRKA